jgi:hypothetical protein
MKLKFLQSKNKKVTTYNTNGKSNPAGTPN